MNPQEHDNIHVGRVYVGAVWTRVIFVRTPGTRAFLLIGGIGVSSHYFEQLAPYLKAYGPVYALDLPGFGGVPHGRKALSIRDYADIVERVLLEKDLQDPVIIGHSMGTQIVADLAARRPDLSTLVLISPVVDPEANRTITQAIRFARASWHEPARVKFLAVTAYLSCGFSWFFRVLPKMMNYRIDQSARRVRADTLIIRGEHDAVCPRDWIDRLTALMPAARTEEISGAAHSVMHAHAGEVGRLCVQHAKLRPGHPPAANPALGEDPREQSLSTPEKASAVIREIKGAAIEIAGNIQDNDMKVAQGRTEQAAANRQLRP